MTQPTPIRQTPPRARSTAASVGSAIFFLMLAVTVLLPLNIFLSRWALGLL